MFVLNIFVYLSRSTIKDFFFTVRFLIHITVYILSTVTNINKYYGEQNSVVILYSFHEFYTMWHLK